MKTYVCDACGKVISDPHKERMKEFYIGYSYDFGIVFPVDCTRKTKVHLCDTCYKNLHDLAVKKGE